jgi:hypothetical protein
MKVKGFSLFSMQIWINSVKIIQVIMIKKCFSGNFEEK